MDTSRHSWFDDLLRKACRRVERGFFEVSEYRGNQRYRERVYCYELYHQMSLEWTSTAFILQGEVDKAGHPLFGPNGPQPDFLVHQPNSMDNYAVIEVKSCKARKGGIVKDLKTLSRFQALGYERLIYLIYGRDARRCAVRVKKYSDASVPVEIWLHESEGDDCFPFT